ncbi:MAG: ABC transporter permease [Candidatus Hodarchaeota archaeon]
MISRIKRIKKVKKIFSFSFYKSNASRVFTLVEKNLKLQIRFKSNFIYSIISPIFTIFLAFIVLGKIFESTTRLGRWNAANFYVFLLIAFKIELLRNIIHKFPNDFVMEKYWKTLSALMIAPINKIHFLLAFFFTHIIVIAIPFAILFILTYLIWPISFFTVIAIIFIYLLIDLIFSGIGLFLGVFAISEENYWRILDIGVTFVFVLSCITYPLELFPDYLQSIIRLNPLFYIFDIVRLTWLDNNILVTMSNIPLHFSILIISAISIPIIAIYIFRVVYNKFGIIGY